MSGNLCVPCVKIEIELSCCSWPSLCVCVCVCLYVCVCLCVCSVLVGSLWLDVGRVCVERECVCVWGESVWRVCVCVWEECVWGVCVERECVWGESVWRVCVCVWSVCGGQQWPGWMNRRIG